MTEIKNKAATLIKSNLFLSVEQKKEWEAMVFFMEEKDVEKLIEILSQNQADLEKMLKEAFEKDPKLAEKLASEVKSFKSQAQKGVADASQAKDVAAAEEQLEEELKNI